MGKEEKQQWWAKIGLLLAAAVTTAYLLMLGWYNLPSLDDYGFVYEIEELGHLPYVRNMYLTWQGRFSAVFVSSFTIPFFGRMSNLVPYTVLMLLVGIWVTGLLIKWILKIEDCVLLWSVAVVVHNVTTMAVLESSTFYWLCCFGYFMVVYATMLVVGLLFFSQSKAWIRWIGVVLCSLYICGNAENYTPLVIMVLGLYFLCVFFVKKQYRFWKDERMLMLFVSLLIMGIGFLLMLFAPGNKVRMGGGEEPDGFMQHFVLIPFVLTSIKATAIFMLRLLSRSLWYLAVFPVFIWIGSKMKKEGLSMTDFKLKHFLMSLLALGIFIFIAVATCVYGTGWYAPPRSESYMSFVLMAFAAYWGIGIGGKVENRCGVVRIFACCSCLAMTAVMIAFFIEVQPEAKNYHAQIAQRNMLIKEQVTAGRTEPLFIEPLQIQYQRNSYYLLRNGIYRCFGKTFTKDNELWYPYMPSILSQDPHDFKNAGLQHYYDAQFEIIGNDKDLLLGEEQ